LPITPFLDGHKFDAETKRVRGVAFEMPRAALRLADRGDLGADKCSPEGSSTLSAILIFCVKVKDFREQRL
jgi:hypothetical protein